MPTPDPVTAADWRAWCDSAVGEDEPPDPDEVEDPELAVAWECDLDAIVAECRRITAEEAAACARAARLGLAGGQPVGLARRGPGEPGSARRAPGEFLSRAAGFAAGMLLDTMAGCGALAGFAAEAAGEDDRFGGAGDDEVAGVIAAWDRVEAHAAARKHAAVAEFMPLETASWICPKSFVSRHLPLYLRISLAVFISAYACSSFWSPCSDRRRSGPTGPLKY